MISFQKASKLGISSEDVNLKENSDKQKKFLVRNDCSQETIDDIRRHYGNVVFSEPLNADEFDRSIQKIYKDENTEPSNLINIIKTAILGMVLNIKVVVIIEPW